MKPIRAGQLRHRVTVQTNTQTRGADGQYKDGFATTATRWASVEPMDGAQAFENGTQKQRVTHKVTMRYYDGLTPDMRLVHKTRNLDIVEVRDINERERMTVALCTEAV